jgi:hypothetical protein
MIIRLISVSDHMQLPAFHDAFRAILGWSGDLGYIDSPPRAGVQQPPAEDAIENTE